MATTTAAARTTGGAGTSNKTCGSDAATVMTFPDSMAGQLTFTMPLCVEGARDGNTLRFAVSVKRGETVLSQGTKDWPVSCRGDATCLTMCGP